MQCGRGREGGGWWQAGQLVDGGGRAGGGGTGAAHVGTETYRGRLVLGQEVAQAG